MHKRSSGFATGAAVLCIPTEDTYADIARIGIGRDLDLMPLLDRAALALIMA